MLRVGLTGGIGSGKSEVSRRLAAYGAFLIDADAIAREVVEPRTPGLDSVVAEFGRQVLRPDGTLDRDRLGEIVFADGDRRAALNAIVHPLVGARMQELQEAAPADAIIIYDVPLLTENNLAEFYDLVVVVDTSEQEQLRRLVNLRGMTEASAKARMGAQATREQRQAIADLVIDNSGTLDDLTAQVEDVWKKIRART